MTKPLADTLARIPNYKITKVDDLLPWRGKAFHSAAATIAGIEVAHMIRKEQIPADGASAFQTFARLAA